MKKTKLKSARKLKSKSKRPWPYCLSEDEAFGLVAQEILRQVDSGKIKVTPFKPSDLDGVAKSKKLKLPEIDLRELAL